MAYYEELSPMLMSIIGERFLRNKELCKLLYCYTPNCDNNDKNKCCECKILKDTSKLFMTHIYPMPKIPDAKTDKKAYICAYFNGGFEPDKNTGYRNVVLNVDIICHIDVWMTENGFRVYDIMHQIDKLLNNQLTDLPVVNRPYLRGFQVRTYTQYFYGVQLLYNFQVNSNVECNTAPSTTILKNGAFYDPQEKECDC